MTPTVAEDLLWPTLDGPDDLADVESVPLAERRLPASTYSLLQRAGAMWPERDAIVVLPDAARWQEPVRRTFAELLAEVEAVAQLLHDNGIGRNDAVALLSPNCAELVTATLAAQAAGIAAPINPGLSGRHISKLLARAGARVVIAAGPELDGTVWSTACEIAADGNVTALFALRPTGASGEPPSLDRIDGVHIAYLADSVEPGRQFTGGAAAVDDIAALFHTGGTTGDPKLAAHTHGNEIANAWMVALNSAVGSDSTLFAALPLFHVNAVVVTLLAPLFRGQTVVWAGPLGYRDLPLYAEFWKIVEQYRVAAMSAVPTVYSVLAQCTVDADISSLTSCIVGASSLPPAVRDSFETRTGVPLLQGYGLTEATCASARSFAAFPRPDSVGQRMPYQQIEAVRQTDAGSWIQLPAGETGTIVISGPTVFAGYVLGRNETGFDLDGLGKLVDGWLDTGDLGRVDADGFVQLTGRAKDLIIRGGHNIDPATIEDALLAHPNVTGAAAVGSPDPHAGEVPVAYVTVSPGADVNVPELEAWARAHVVEPAAAPRTVTVLDALPVTDVGKPYKIALRANAARVAAIDALRGTVDASRISTNIVDGSVVVVISGSIEHSLIDDLLGRYPIEWRIDAAL
ncbi:acyl-CoA synthetase [Rhodococcus sp. P1Y]|uniref:acyl-CoA synthetase n=1 Tax=Rhodococcus sp. P1Y TaxID=1302308 RepID=UPI001911CB2E|nr:acyl-CoA synthetase [Rhodococcus sp. P1Y]